MTFKRLQWFETDLRCLNARAGATGQVLSVSPDRQLDDQADPQR